MALAVARRARRAGRKEGDWAGEVKKEVSWVEAW
jgi:hypothetical protein